VEAVGKNVTQFKPGDEVFGVKAGALAEYICVRADRALVLKPANVTFEQAAAIPVAGFTALRALRDSGRVRPGQSVLVNGAAGGVGTFAVQIAKAFGAEVTGVCSARNVALVRSLGADRVIDYGAEDFTRQARRYDVILNVAGNVTVADARRALGSRGILVVVGGGVGRDPESGITVPGILALMLNALVSRFGRRRVSMLVARQITHDDLDFIAKLAEAGKLTPVVDRSYSLADAAEAVRYLEGGHVRGKVVVTPGRA
jgi:NADPH:quinone reductase-like Zn-dependent oxidoreductase